MHPSASSALPPPAWRCWTGQTHPWLQWSSTSSVAKSQLVGRYRVLDAHKSTSGHFGHRARDFAPRRLSRRQRLVERRLDNSPRQVGMRRTHMKKSIRPSRSMLGLSGNRSFHTETSYRKSGGSRCGNHPQHLPTPFIKGSSKATVPAIVSESS